MGAADPTLVNTGLVNTGLVNTGLVNAPAGHLGEQRVQRVIDIAAPLSRHLIDSALVPVPNPAGARRP